MPTTQMNQKSKRKKQLHVNAIINQFKLCQQLYADQKLKKQQKSLRKFQNSRRSSVVINNPNIASDLYNNIFEKQKQNSVNMNKLNFSSFGQQKLQQSRLLNNFMNKLYNKKHENSKFFLSYQNHDKTQQHKNKSQQQNKKSNKQADSQKNEKKQNARKFILNKSKYRIKDVNKNLIMSSINTKIRQLSLISKTFDKINENYDYQLMLMDNKNQRRKLTNTQLILKQFQNNLSIGSNFVTQRKHQLKRNIKNQFRYKANTKRYQTQANQAKANCHQIKQIWLHDANKLKSYIMGGYHDQRQQFSNTYDIDEFRKLKRNFQTFDQIYNEIKEDTFNPISTLATRKLQIQSCQRNQPNILQMVSVMQKQQQVNKYQLY